MPDLHSRIVGGSTASRVLHCPGSVAILDNMQWQIDQAADELLASCLTMPPEAAKVQEQKAEALRGSLNQSSSYADEGTALHTVMEYLLGIDEVLPDNKVSSDREIIKIFMENNVEFDRMHDAVLPAYHQFNEYLDKVLAEDGDEFKLRVESRVEFPDIDDAFGTCDVLIRTAKRTIVWDWKFGAGVPVDASYFVEDAQGSVTRPDGSVGFLFGNDQLTYYAVAARHSHPEYFGGEVCPNSGLPCLASCDQKACAGLHTPIDQWPEPAEWPVELVICQPRVRDELSTYTSSIDELEDFKLDLVEAVEEALSGSTTYKLGKWCKFQACQSQCPLRADTPVGLERLASKLGKLKLAASAPAAAQTAATLELGDDGQLTSTSAAKLAYAEALGLMLDLEEILEPYLSEAAKQAYTFMEAGGRIPGRKLVPKRAGHDSFKERDDTDSFLSRRGLSIEERRKPWDTVTPAVARKLLKAKGDDKGLKLLEKYVQPGVSSGSTIAKSDDPRPEYVSSSAAVEQIAEKLKQIGVAK